MAEKSTRVPRMALGGAVGVAVAILVATAVALAPARPPVFHGTTYTEVAPAAPFSLVDHEGRRVSLESYRGHPVLLFFGYTQCPDVCPTTLAKLTNAARDAGADGVRILLLTVDPANDTPAVLREYVAGFGPVVVGLTGDTAALAAARREYGAYVERMPAAPAAAHGEHAAHAGHPAPAAGRMVHSGVVYGIDRRGNLQVVISDSATPDQVRDDVRALARI